MSNLEQLYFEWLLKQLDPDGVAEGVEYVAELLHHCYFLRRVGNDINRAVDGADLRKEYLRKHEDIRFDPRDVDTLLDRECTWLEMLIALARDLDFLYEGGVEGRFIELISNLGLHDLVVFTHLHSLDDDLEYTYVLTDNVNNNRIDRNGHGGIFPLKKSGHPDQREVEIWDQQASYFRERLEGVLWTSIM